MRSAFRFLVLLVASFAFELGGFVLELLGVIDHDLSAHGSTASGEWRVHVVVGGEGLASLAFGEAAGLPQGFASRVVAAVRGRAPASRRGDVVSLELLIRLRATPQGFY